MKKSISSTACVIISTIIGTVALGKTDTTQLKSLTDKGTQEYQSKNYSDAEKDYTAALTIARETKNELAVAVLTMNLAVVETDKGKYKRALALLKESFDIKLAKLGIDNPSTITTVKHTIALLNKMGRNKEADDLSKLIAPGPNAKAPPFGCPQGYSTNIDHQDKTPQKTRQQGIKTTIVRIVTISDSERSYLSQPTMSTRQVIDHYEYRTQYKYGPNGTSIPYEIKVPICKEES
jgi:tetratricopeptide (TPR) repeat protein